MRRRAVYTALALCLYAFVAATYYPLVPPQPYNYDESDYMWAGRQGFLANYLDRNGLPFREFVLKGIELVRDESKRLQFSQFIRARGDVGMYRHYHGPMYAYWLAALHRLGVQREQVFRGSGLLIHFASATLILFGFWQAFPSLPEWTALLACALFTFSRTALVAATLITQHVAVTLFTVAALFAGSLFLERLEARWLYASMAAFAAALCTAENSILILAALAAAILIERGRISHRWPTRKQRWLLAGNAALTALVVAFALWPKGIAGLGIVKGFGNMAYFSLFRKTFSPFGTLDLWTARFTAAPWEFAPLAAGAVIAFLFWRKFPARAALTPWLAFIGVYLLVTLKVTLPYTYYYAPLVSAFAVASAAAFGALYQRRPELWASVPAAAAAASLIPATIQYHAVAAIEHDRHSYVSGVLRWLKTEPMRAGEKLCVPLALVPVLHYYVPEWETQAYDGTGSIHAINAGAGSPGLAVLICEAPVCDSLDQAAPGISGARMLLDHDGPSSLPLYAVRLGIAPSLSPEGVLKSKNE